MVVAVWRCRRWASLALLALAGTAAKAAQLPFVGSKMASIDEGVINAGDAHDPINGAGRFLHITDMHPDKFYAPYAPINDACHNITSIRDEEIEDDDKIFGDSINVTDDLDDLTDHKKPKKHKKAEKPKKPKKAGYWGTPNSVCDAPEHLIGGTLEWLAREWTSKEDRSSSRKAFDFIIWTGDTARHDLDFTHPRKAEEIFDYNRRVLALMRRAFPDTPIVPSLGNNDIIPHNIMFPGPNSMTKAYTDVWSDLIPEDQRQAFSDGGYFVQEVIAGDLAVISINTLYFFDSNTATRGCKKRSEPGSIQLDWLAEELAALRARGMQAHVIGHVPPTAGNYYPACYDRYTDIVLRYQDTIVGQHFGHMNIDAWFLQEDEYLSSQGAEVVHTEARVEGRNDRIRELTLADDLRKDYDLVPTHQKTNLDAYLPFFVAPSVVPTYMPTVRVWTYNASRPAGRRTIPPTSARAGKAVNETSVDLSEYIDDEIVRSTLNVFNSNNASRHVHPLSRSHRRPSRGKKKNRRRQSPHVSPDSPSRKNSYLTPLGYSQWVLDLDRVNRQHKKLEQIGATGNDTAPERINYHLEYTTYDRDTLWGDYIDGPLPSHAHRPVPKALLDSEVRLRGASQPRLESADGYVHASKKRHVSVPKALKPLTDYALPSMTVERMLDLARDLAANDALWSRYVRRIYAESGAEDG